MPITPGSLKRSSWRCLRAASEWRSILRLRGTQTARLATRGSGWVDATRPQSRLASAPWPCRP
eukprot:17837-Prymnesium_polylepis.1